MNRIYDWPRILKDMVDEARDKPFEWGVRDCCMWAADVVKAMTGEDLAAAYRGTYTDEAGANVALEQSGGIEQVLINALGEPIENVNLAQRGDVVLYAPRAAWSCLMICTGSMICGPGARGLTFVPLQHGKLACRVPM